MTLIVELTPEQEAQLSIQAHAAGVDPAEYVRALIVNIGSQTMPGAARPKTGAEVLDELKGLNLPPGYGDPSIDSPELARQLSARFSRPSRDRREASQ
jgi:hypothetical protein